MADKIIIDTGPLLAYLDNRDGYHHWVTEQMAEIEPPLYTCEAVISETIFLLKRENIRTMYLFEILVRGDLVIEPVFNTQTNQKRIRAFIANYADLPASFADACLVRMHDTTRGASIFTLDDDFNIYRSQSGNPLSLIAPQ